MSKGIEACEAEYIEYILHVARVSAEYEAKRVHWLGWWPAFDRLSHAERMQALKVQK